MGGYRSGRTKEHQSTSECIQIDLAALHTFLRSEKTSFHALCTETHHTVKGHEQQKHHLLHLTLTRYEDDGLFAQWGATAHLTIRYEESQVAQIPLVTTPCNYGHMRYWMLAPCCGRRTRVLYLPPSLTSSLPQCRICLDLHYASQQQSFIEKRKTYERYLLANYGWMWAELEYHALGTHYQEITPELAEKQARSKLTVWLGFIRHLMAFNRLMLNDHVRAFRTLRSAEDRRLYLDVLIPEWGSAHILLILEQSKGHRYATDEEIESLIGRVSGQAVPAQNYTYDMHSLTLLKQEVEQDLEELAA